MIYHLLCRFFWLVGVQYIDRSIPYEASTIHGTRELHSIQTKSFQNMFAFDSRKQSCFYVKIGYHAQRWIDVLEFRIIVYLKMD